VYGQRKLKRVLSQKCWTVSRRRIGRIMAKRGLISAYTCKKHRAHSSKSNEAAIPNLLARDFNNQAPGACVVSDLTYVRVGTRWAYVCILLELGAREIIGQSAGANRNADLVHKAFSTVKGNLFDIQMFHTDRGSEFDNMLIDELLDSFQINRSLSMKGCPYDNAVAESTFIIRPNLSTLAALKRWSSSRWSCWIMFTGSTTSVYTERLDICHQQSLRDPVPYKIRPTFC